MVYPKNTLNRYFWAGNVLFWMAVYVLFVFIQYKSALGTPTELELAETFLVLSPWFASWIWLTAGIFILVYNINVDSISLAKKCFFHLVGMATLLLLYWSFTTFVHRFVSPSEQNYLDHLDRIITNSSQIDIALYLPVLVLAMAFKFYHDSVNEKLVLRQLQKELYEEQLKSLRSQLNPHFLFNTLNTIASLVRLKRDKEAVTALSELSLMLRKILENKNSDCVRVKDEIAFINSYLAIQKMRFGNKLDARIYVEPACLDLQIPNMLLHPIVENAVQHGSQLESNDNLLNLEICKKDDQLSVKLTNQVAHNDDHKGFGIGVGNTRARLSKLYQDFAFELNPLDEDFYETSLTIPIGELDA